MFGTQNKQKENWFFQVVIPIFCALLAAGYFREEILLLFQSKPNYVGITNQVKNANKEHQLYYDDWKLRFSGTDIVAVVRPRDMDTQWKETGYAKAGFMAMAYKSGEDRYSGIGSLFLEYDIIHQVYKGKLTAFDCTIKELVRCPYVLSPVAAEKTTETALNSFLSQECEFLGKVKSAVCKN